MADIPDKQQKLLDLLESLSMEVVTVNHPEVFTVEAMMPYLQDCDGLVCKNLFLKDKKKKRLWLFVAKHDRTTTLTDLAKKMKISGGFRFADEQVLIEKLDVTQGCVTPLSVHNDANLDVTVILDSVLASGNEIIFSHPMVNNATVGLKTSDFLKYLQHTKHEPVLVNLDE